MKVLIAACLAAFVAAPAFTQVRPLRQQLRPPVRDGAGARGGQTPILDMVEGFYVSQLPAMTELSDEQFVKILPVLRQSLRERFEISARRTRAVAELRQLVERGGSDEEMTRLIREMDRADAGVQASREKFLASVDPLLAPRQQARLRMALIMIEQRVGNMIQRAGNANRGQGLPPPPPPPPGPPGF
jgi:hypothetical protein